LRSLPYSMEQVRLLAGPCSKGKGPWLPVDELHYQIIRPNIVELADVRMIQRGHRTRLALEAFVEFDLRGLDRNRAVEPRVARFPHLTHASGADG